MIWPLNSGRFPQWLEPRRPVPLLVVGAVLVVLYGFWKFTPRYSPELFSLFSRSGKIIYVKSGSPAGGTGKSWDKAFDDLQPALRSAKKGDQIWVATGTYKPTYDGNRDLSFVLVEAVSLFGGFLGSETRKEERDPEKHRTVLSGEIGTADSLDDSHTVVLAERLSALTVVDGFVIRGGRADGVAPGVTKSTCGGAWFNHNASPTIRNCRFEANNARLGGAMYNFAGKNGTASPRISNCRFADNQADLDGGCLYNNGDEGICRPQLEHCIFENNIATYGAGIMNRARYGLTMVQVLACEFYKNKALVKGSVIYNHRDKTGVCNAKVEDCIFKGNYTTVGREIDGNFQRDPADPRNR
ncbi:hypothetical protein CRP01_24800 [Flavilitoribacter nigricans DSM 23189 = NBRC 102662]|uniref:Right handed beta helix domain-containing protein n=2 Tax=Flavilitoribacter TaxID=2762562 RepID=A0A2D0N5I3_FLAN2|nr:hypothetical protein CRP01_24800 [Flavilitoribacter nigricans DSM 23189 = NBRC 102662]